MFDINETIPSMGINACWVGPAWIEASRTIHWNPLKLNCPLSISESEREKGGREMERETGRDGEIGTEKKTDPWDETMAFCTSSACFANIFGSKTTRDTWVNPQDHQKSHTKPTRRNKVERNHLDIGSIWIGPICVVANQILQHRI